MPKKTFLFLFDMLMNWKVVCEVCFILQALPTDIAKAFHTVICAFYYRNNATICHTPPSDYLFGPLHPSARFLIMGAKLDFLLSPRVIKPCDCFIKFQRISSFLHYRTSSSISSASTGNGRRQLVDRSDLGVEDSRLSFSRCRLYLRFDGECLLLSSRG